jgi:putative phage-type endonuclease
MIPHMIQGSDCWKKWRLNKIGASDSVIIAGLSPWRTKQELWAEKLGLIEPQPVNSSMRRGMMLEGPARRCYEKMTGIDVVDAIKVSEDYSWCFASLDGISLDGKTLVEIKCTSKKNHELAKNGQIPEYYIPQVQHQIYVCGVDSCDYFSYDGNEGIIVPVLRDDVYISNLLTMEKEFYNCMLNLTEPK